jgi:hypothetical protein
VAVEDKKTIDSAHTRRSMFAAALLPLNTELIGRPAIIAHWFYPVIRQIAIPAGVVELSRQDQERCDRPPRRVSTLDCLDPVVIT